MTHIYLYSLVCETLIHPDIGQYISYGIKVAISGSASTVAYVSDVSAIESKVSELVAMCNKLKLSPCHLMDVIEDFLAD